LKKKKQKTFLNWAVLVSTPPAQRNKEFLRRFFQKAALSFQAAWAGARKACKAGRI
jgi:hypothetical protein